MTTPEMAGFETLDLRGLKCPLPVLRTRQRLRGLGPGAGLLVLCTDQLAAIDIPHFLREGHGVLIRQDTVGGVLRFWIRRGGLASA